MVIKTAESKISFPKSGLIETGEFLPSDNVVALRAYQFWTERGRPLGSPDEDWLRAERQIRHDRTPGAVV